MLSPHEIATLMVIKNAPCRIGPGRAELDALLALELVTVMRPAPGFLLAHVTPLGEALLQAMAQIF